MEPMPNDKQRAARIALAVLAGALGTTLVAGGLWVAFKPRPSEAPRQTEIRPAEETKPETLTGGAGSSESTETTAPAGEDDGDKNGGAPPTGGGLFGGGSSMRRAAKVAYRKGGKVWVADESGKNAVAVTFGYNAYALSPDGNTLAVVADVHEPLAPRAETPKIKLLDVKLKSLDAVSEQPSWAGTSAWLAFTVRVNDAAGVKRIDASGSDEKTLATQGSAPKVSLDGKAVCYLGGSSGAVPSLVVANEGGGSSSATVGGSQGALSWGWGPKAELFFAKSSSTPGTWELRRSRAPYDTSQRLGMLELTPPAFALHDIHVSPDGRRVVLSSFGDDEFSRLWVFDVSGARFHTISTRRDAYPYGWSANGSRILYFEGNAYQGEPSSLMSCRPDGSGRTVVVEGAAR